MLWRILFSALIGALIGYVTNDIAIRLLFRPLRPRRVLGMTLQGLIPRRQHEIAASLGQIMAEHILDGQALAGKLMDPDTMGEVESVLERTVCKKVAERLSQWIPGRVRDAVARRVARAAVREARTAITEMAPSTLGWITNRLDVERMVEQSVNELSAQKLEEVLLTLARKEVAAIKVLGGVIGLMIGLVQSVVSIYLF
mgnify:CR=1 FL=1